MNLSITPVNCNKPQLDSHKRPNFGAKIGDGIEPMLKFISESKRNVGFRNAFDKKGHKISDLFFRDGEAVTVNFEPGKKPNIFKVIAQKDGTEALGEAKFKFKDFFSGRHNFNSLVKSIKKSISAIDTHPAQVLEDMKVSVDDINQMAKENEQEILNSLNEEKAALT